MTFYPVPNPYRASTGSMPLHVTTVPSSSTSHRHPNHYNSTKYEETCESCGSSYTDEHLLRINTPYSAPPNTSSASLQPSSSGHRRSSSGHRSPSGHRSRRSSTTSAHHEPPKVLTRYPNGALVLEPASSYTHERRQQPSHSSSSAMPGGSAAVPRTHQYHYSNRHEARKSWANYESGPSSNYEADIAFTADSTAVRGTTKIPRRLVNKDAVKQMGYQYEEDRVTGAITVQRVLGKEELQRLVELTEQLRANRHSSSSGTESHEKHVRIITHPTETFKHQSNAPVAQQSVVVDGRRYYHANKGYTPSPNSAYLNPNSRHGHRRSASTSAMPTTTTVRVGADGRREVVVLK